MVVRVGPTRMKDTGSISISSSAGERKLVFANSAPPSSKKRDELSISSASARLWISVPRKASTALFWSPVGCSKSIQSTFSLLIAANSVSDCPSRMSEPCL